MDRTHALPITRQARLLGISRSNLYYRPVAASAGDLRQMRRIDDLHLELPSNPCRSRRPLNPQRSTYPTRENCLVLWAHLSVPFPAQSKATRTHNEGSTRYITIGKGLSPFIHFRNEVQIVPNSVIAAAAGIFR